MGPSRATEQRVVGGGPGFVLVESYQGLALGEGFNLPIGVSGGMLPTVSFVTPEGTDTSPQQGGPRLGWTLHGDLFLPGFRLTKDGPTLGLTLQYQYGYKDLEYAGGFGLGSRQHGVLGFLGVDFGGLGLELGAGGLFDGAVGVGARGNVADDRAFSFGQAPTGGFRTATRATLFISGGGYLQMKTAIRLEAGYQRVQTLSTPPPGVPLALRAFDVGGELVITFF